MGSPLVYFVLYYSVPRTKPLDTTCLDFIDPSFDVSRLTVSSEQKVPVICADCTTPYNVTFFSAYKQRQKRGRYVCRACTARVNGTLAAKGLDKRKQTNLVRYGVEHPTQNAAFYATRTRHIKDIWVEYIDSHGHPMHNPVSRARLVETNLERHGVPYSTLLPQVQNTLTERKESEAEREVRAYLQQTTGDEWASDWSVIAPKQLDCYNARLQVAVEFNGLVWHSERMGADRWKHHAKYAACRDQNIQLLTVFEDEWMQRRPQVEAVLRSRLGMFDCRIYGRQTTVTQVPTRDAFPYINRWHIQPQQRAKYAALMWYAGDVVGAITFTSHHRATTDTSIVLSRMCFAPGVQVVGGASKLVSAMIPTLRAAGYTQVVSWSDNRWSDGGVYRQMGWTRDAELDPDYSYVDLTRRGVRHSKQSCRKTAIKAVPGETERQRITALGLSRIWDCGKVRWILKV